MERERDIPHSHGHTADGATAGLQVTWSRCTQLETVARQNENAAH